MVKQAAFFHQYNGGIGLDAIGDGAGMPNDVVNLFADKIVFAGVCPEGANFCLGEAVVL